MLKWFKGLPRLLFCAASLFCLLCISACSAYLTTQSRLGVLIDRQDYARADSLIGSKENAYGRNNKLLYLLDKGLVSHIAGDYTQSISAFERAKKEYDRLYTKSLTGIIGTWLLNDYAAAYRGEDFERVMVDVFQALNYAALDNLEEALVEARDVDSQLKLINSRYASGQTNVYKEDAFARFLSGVLYEAGGNSQGYNDAFIAYSKAVDTYEKDYTSSYGTSIPLLLKENLFAAAEFMGAEELSKCRSRYGNVKFESLSVKASKAELYFIQYNGRTPPKMEIIIPLVLPDGYVVSLAFPEYEGYLDPMTSSQFTAVSAAGRLFRAQAELVEDITAIARKNLADRKARVIAKALVSSAGKYFAEKTAEGRMKKEYGPDAGAGLRILSSLFNIFTNRADLRSWRTLPYQIRIARLVLEPGEYALSVTNFGLGSQPLEKRELGRFRIKPGEKKFITLHTAY